MEWTSELETALPIHGTAHCSRQSYCYTNLDVQLHDGNMYRTLSMTVVKDEEVGKRGESYVVGGVRKTGVPDIVAATMQMQVDRNQLSQVN